MCTGMCGEVSWMKRDAVCGGVESLGEEGKNGRWKGQEAGGEEGAL